MELTNLLYTKRLLSPTESKAVSPCLDWATIFRSKFDLHLNNGRLLEHFTRKSDLPHDGSRENSGHVVRVPRTRESVDSKRDLGATRFGYGQVRVRALVTDACMDGAVHAHELCGESVNRLTSTTLTRDNTRLQRASVNLKVLPKVGENPLPRNNSRFGHPTPQNG